ncbi:unnamed protein product [Meganyctiphanes norvegica]|uniref:Uncharacterized protein n=1 Tax=Meganyctiphanes norvegica TaxID=48144 RepID=A0AAV2QNK8_MEGNR
MVYLQLIDALDDVSVNLIRIVKGRDGAECWRILVANYEGSCVDKVHVTVKEVSNLKKGDEESMSEYIARADNIIEIFSNNNVAYDDIFLIRAVKDGLPKEYEVLVDDLDTKKKWIMCP